MTEARGVEWSVASKNKHQPRILDLVKLSFRNQGEINSFGLKTFEVYYFPLIYLAASVKRFSYRRQFYIGQKLRSTEKRKRIEG